MAYFKNHCTSAQIAKFYETSANSSVIKMVYLSTCRKHFVPVCQKLTLGFSKVLLVFFLSRSSPILFRYCSAINHSSNLPLPIQIMILCRWYIGVAVTFFKKICRCRDSNRGPLVSEATALPTEPPPLP